MIIYLIALVPISEEVRSRCHVKHTLPRWPMEINSNNELIGEAQNLASQTVSTENNLVKILQIVGI